jgi:5'-nucleotidase
VSHPSSRLAAVAAALLLFGCGLPPAPAPTSPVRVLLVNDVYVSDTMADGSGGLARVARERARLAAEGPLLFVLAGDVLSPSLLSKYYSGRQMVDAFNAAKLDYATFGNHEFELARDTLVARIAESKFTWLSANCTGADGAPFPGVLAFDTVTVQDTVRDRSAGEDRKPGEPRKIGIFGITLQGSYRSYVRCGDPDAAARSAIDTLGKLGAELIIGLTHQGLAADRALLTREPTLDLILGGHEHEAIDETVGNRHILKADANARSAQFATVWGKKGEWVQAVTLIRIDDAIPPDTAVARVTAAWQDSLRRRLGAERVVGTAIEPIDARDFVSRRGESPIGDLVTDAMRSGTGADVALLNAGTLRLDDVIAAGPVSSYTLESLFLFADEARVVTFPLSGARLRELLEHGVAEGSVGAGPFLQVSGVRFTWDPSKPSGSRIVGDVVGAAGRPIRATDTVRVAFDVYPACEGGDGYTVPEAREACATWQQAPRAADLLIRHVTERLGGKIQVPEGGRVTRAGGSAGS